MPTQHLPESVNLVKIDGTTRPFEHRAFDIVFTATVLQHNTDENILKQFMSEICRVAKEKTQVPDKVFTSRKDIARLEFKRK